MSGQGAVRLTEVISERLGVLEAAAQVAKWPYGERFPEAPPWPNEQQWSRQLSSDEGPLLALMSPDFVLRLVAGVRALVAELEPHRYDSPAGRMAVDGVMGIIAAALTVPPADETEPQAGASGDGGGLG